MLKNLALIITAMLCWQASVSAQTYIQENFDAGLPGTWVIGDGGTTTDTWMGTTGGRGGDYLNGTTEFLIADSDAAGAGVTMNDTITTPAFNSSLGSTVYVDFTHFYQTYSGADIATVEVFDGATWQVVATFTAVNTGSFAAPDMQHIDVTAHKNAAMQVRFTYSNAVYEWYWAIDDVHIYSASCLAPTALAASNITSTTADLTWTAGGAIQAGWMVSVVPAGSPASAGNFTAANSMTATGLTPNTAYSVYLREVCAPGDSSVWVGPLAFSTPCNTVTPNYTETFNTVSTTVFDLASCWTAASGQLGTTSVLTPGNGGWAGKAFVNTGATVAAYTNLYDNTVGQWLISPSIDLGTGNGYHLEFDIGATVYNATTAASFEPADSFAVVISVDNGVTWTTANMLQAWAQGAEPSSTGDHIDIDLTAYSGVVKFAFYGVASAATTSDFDLFVEDFMVRTPPTCLDPSALAVANVTTTTADLTWTAGNVAQLGWEVSIVPMGMPAMGGTPSATASFNATGLAEGITYDAYIREICASADTSVWVGPITFATQCNTIFTAPYAEGFEDPNALNCWSIAVSSANYSWFSNTGQTPTGAVGNETGPDGASIPAVATDTVYMYVEASAPAAANDVARLQSPAIDLTALTTPELTFEYHMAGADITLLYIQVDNGAGYVTVDSIVGAQQLLRSDPWLTKTVDLTAFTGNIQLGFLTGRGASFNGDLSIDDISVDNAPPPPVANLMISEIMYNTPSNDTAEFIEIYNNGTMPVDLTGYSFGAGVVHTFTGGTIAAGDYFVITLDTVDFNFIYGFAADDEWTSGSLVNSSEDLVILDNLGRLVDSVRYDDGAPNWPTGTDGQGASIVLCDTTADNNDGANWSRSYTNANTTIGGTAIFASPGAANNCTVPPTNDVEVTMFIGLNNNYCNVASATGQVVITNNTATPETNVPYTIAIAGIGPIGGGFIPSLGANASDTFAVGPVPLATTGIYTISVYTSMLNDGNTANDTLTQTIAVSNTTAAISGSTNVSCNAGMDGTATAMGSDGLGAYTFTWTPSGQTTAMATGLAANTYEVVVADTSNCTDTAMVTITEPTAVVASTTDNADGTATASGSGGTVATGYTFMWDATAGSQTTATATGLMSGNNYCVTITDDNGCTADDCVTVVFVGLEAIANTAAFKVYPNPTTNNVFVELGLDTPTDVQLTVFNAIGENVMTKQLNGQATRIELNTEELPTGVYLMRFAVENEISTQKLIIQRP